MNELELPPPDSPGPVPSPSSVTKATRQHTYREWFGDRWDDVQAFGGALMLTIRFLVWVFDLDDGAGTADWRKASPSATKLAGLAMVTVGLGIAVSKKDTNAAINILIIAGCSALFGRGMWKAFLARNEIKQAASAAVAYAREDRNLREDVNIQETRRLIEERRDSTQGTEATP